LSERLGEVLFTFKKFPAWITPDGNKVPIIKDWQTLATDNKIQLDQWFKKYNGPNFLWGIPTGKVNNIYALDVDMKKGKNGQESLTKLGEAIPNTAWQQTRSGGYHLVFRPNGQVLGNSVNFLDGLDIRGEGGWIADYGIEQSTASIADFPSWLYPHIKSRPEREQFTGEIARIPTDLANKMVADLCERIETAADGQGNNTLNECAFEAGQILASCKKINEEWLQEQLMKASTKNGRRSERESRATIESGLSSGRTNPQLIDVEGFKNLKTEYVKPASPESKDLDFWLPSEFKLEELNNTKALRKPQLFEDWLSEDICLFNASGGTGKTTLKLYEAICMRLGEDFLGFKCKAVGGKTLFITGEDTEPKLKAMIGQILKQTGLISDTEKVKKILSGIFIKKDTDMQLVTKTPNGWSYNTSALETSLNAIRKLGVKKVVYDPLSIFWGSEQQVNDMTRGVVKFATKLTEETNVCLEFIHHLNVDNSKTKDMSQFAGRGGSVIPSHSRIVTTMRAMDDEDILTMGVKLAADETGILCNVGKFSDGSKLLNKPFVIVRKGYLFRREDVKIVQQVKGKKQDGLPEELIINWIKSERDAKRYPTKSVIEAQFGGSMGKAAAKQGLKNLEYLGFNELRIKKIDNPNGESREQVYVVIDKEGNEI
jgi:RecA-family ATPase